MTCSLEKPFVVVPINIGTVTAGNERVLNPASNLNLPNIGMTWKTTGASSVFIRGELSEAKEIDFISLISANATAGTTIRVRLGASQSEVDGVASYDSGEVLFVPMHEADDESETLSLDFINQIYKVRTVSGLSQSHLELNAPFGARWWRIDITNHTDDFEASCLVMGKKYTPSKFYSPGFQRGATDMGEFAFNRWGVGREVSGKVLRTLSFKLSWMTEAEMEEKFLPLSEQLGLRKPALWCFNPSPSVHRQARTYFGRFKREPAVTTSPIPRYFAMDFEIESMI